MIENGWTKGPWAYGLRAPECKITAVAHCGDFVIGPDSDYAGGNYRDTDIGDAEADSRLIAASPDLYAALDAVHKLIVEAALTGFNCNTGTWADRLFASQRNTNAALNLAKGRT